MLPAFAITQVIWVLLCASDCSPTLLLVLLYRSEHLQLTNIPFVANATSKHSMFSAVPQWVYSEPGFC